jgi:hypothetical protein
MRFVLTGSTALILSKGREGPHFYAPNELVNCGTIFTKSDGERKFMHLDIKEIMLQLFGRKKILSKCNIF